MPISPRAGGAWCGALKFPLPARYNVIGSFTDEFDDVCRCLPVRFIRALVARVDACALARLAAAAAHVGSLLAGVLATAMISWPAGPGRRARNRGAGAADRAAGRGAQCGSLSRRLMERQQSLQAAAQTVADLQQWDVSRAPAGLP
jgi:hypothetical protein